MTLAVENPDEHAPSSSYRTTDPVLDPAKSVWIMNISRTYTARDIHRFFSPFGSISRIVLRGKGSSSVIYTYGGTSLPPQTVSGDVGLLTEGDAAQVHCERRVLVEFREPKSVGKAIHAMQGKPLPGTAFKIQILPHRPRSSTPRVSSSSPPTSKVLFIGDIPRSLISQQKTPEQSLLKSLKSYSIPSPVRVLLSLEKEAAGGPTKFPWEIFALVQFNTLQDAILAQERLSTTDVSIDGRLIWVDFRAVPAQPSRVLIVCDLLPARTEESQAKVVDEVRRIYQRDGLAPLVTYCIRYHSTARGIVYVGFRSIYEAEQALSSVGGIVAIQGRFRSVDYNNPGASKLAPTKSLHLNGLSVNDSEDSILRAFSREGLSLTGAKIVRHQGAFTGRAYVDFLTVQEAMDAMNMLGGGIEIGGRLIMMRYKRVQ